MRGEKGEMRRYILVVSVLILPLKHIRVIKSMSDDAVLLLKFIFYEFRGDKENT